MNRFFYEIEFKSQSGNTYWLPVFIDVNTQKEAKDTANRIKEAFGNHYIVKRDSLPKKYVKGLNSDFVNEYIESRMSGKVEMLEINFWEIKEVDSNVVINFDEALDLVNVDQAKSIDNSIIANTINRQKFPVRVIYKNHNIPEYKDFLMINIVAPKFINKLIGAFKNRRV